MHLYKKIQIFYLLNMIFDFLEVLSSLDLEHHMFALRYTLPPSRNIWCTSICWDKALAHNYSVNK
jgi:hypothetical protein